MCITLQQEVIPKLLDFGLCVIDESSPKLIGERWMPPEGKSRFADSWLFGIFMWEVFTHGAQSAEYTTLTDEEVLPFYQIELENLISCRKLS